MAKKHLANNLRKLKKPNENFFSIPQAMTKRKNPGYIKQTVEGLKPNTRYKIMIDNNPGNIFEDITQFSLPTGSSKRINTKDDQQNGYKWLKTDNTGKLSFKTRPYGTDSASYDSSGVYPPSGGGQRPNYTNYWNTVEARTAENDRGREKIKVIEYSQVENPESNNKLKTIKLPVDPGPDESLPPIPPAVICDCEWPLPSQDFPTVPSQLNSSSFYQTFYIDSNATTKSKTVDITDVTLYIRSKPTYRNNTSGITNPKISIKLLECKEDGTPITNAYIQGGTSTRGWHQIQANDSALQGTQFNFQFPVTVKTNRFYAIAVISQDPGYILWENFKGDLLLVNGNRTEERSGGSSKEHQGDYYPPKSFVNNPVAADKLTEQTWTPNSDLDIKFDVHVAQYQVQDIDVTLVTDNYEFLKISNTAPEWAPDEEVFKINANTAIAGTVSITGGRNIITGNGTDFLSELRDGDTVVLIDNANTSIRSLLTVTTTLGTTTATQIYTTEESLVTITNGTLHNTVFGYVDFYNIYHNTLRLNRSNVERERYLTDNNLRFAPGDTIIGLESGCEGYVDGIGSLPISVFRFDTNTKIPENFDLSTSYNFSANVGGTYVISDLSDNMLLNSPNHVKSYEAEILSRSQEVTQANNLVDSINDYKGSTFNINYTYKGANTKTYSSPNFNINEMQLLTHRWRINNDATNEHTNRGNATTKHISKSLDLSPENKAEDLRVIANVYRPKGTTIQFYAKFYNSQDPAPIEDKNWTRLQQLSGFNRYSELTNKFDFFECEYQVPFFPETRYTLDGEIFTQEGNNTIIIDTNAANTSQIDDLSSNQVVKLFSTLFPTNYQIYTIQSANSTTGEIVLNDPIANSSMAGDGFRLDTLVNENTAFRNPDNYEIIRYFDANGTSYDTYDKVIIKIVLLAESPSIVPKVDDYRVIGVSA